MTLAERESQSRSRTSTNGGFTTPVNNVATYKSPILAVMSGHAVRLIATGDAPGHSPVFQYVDEQGHVNWEEAERFTIIDPHFLPPSQEILRDVSRMLAR